MQFPIYHAALSFEGKPPEELPHGLLTMPPEVREFFAEQSAKSPPGTFARDEVRILNLWTIAWYFDGLHHEVIYRETPEGPDRTIWLSGRTRHLARHTSGFWNSHLFCNPRAILAK